MFLRRYNLPGFAQAPMLLNPAAFVEDGFLLRHFDVLAVASLINAAGLTMPEPEWKPGRLKRSSMPHRQLPCFNLLRGPHFQEIEAVRQL